MVINNNYYNYHRLFERVFMMSESDVGKSLYDVRRQSDLPSPQELRDFMQDGERKCLKRPPVSVFHGF